jgi:hypothetical protein
MLIKIILDSVCAASGLLQSAQCALLNEVESAGNVYIPLLCYMYAWIDTDCIRSQSCRSLHRCHFRTQEFYFCVVARFRIQR